MNLKSINLFNYQFFHKHEILKQCLCIFLFILTLIVAVMSIPFLLVCEIISYFSEIYPIYICTIISHIVWTLYNKILKINAKIIIEGDIDQIKDYENCILLSNHIGSMDFMIGHEFARQKKMLRHCKFLVKRSVILIPLIGWGVRFLKFCFLDRRFDKDQKSICKWTRFIKNNKVPMWLIMYPEGSRFTSQKYQESINFCKSRGIQPINNLLYPRCKGFSLIFDNFKDYFTSLIDVTIKYVDIDGRGVPSIFRFMLMRPKGYFMVYVNTYKISEITNCEEFLVDLWRQKSKKLASWNS
ncbi:putative 1-acyl-sn-glycerol-3-phosphate acyltransferase 4 [Dictyocoela muelleri]|nr:putative 1-acyl-sn-glycerol-3-phosphate acyltransferase 4 [Dictyocoela muelleri]